MYASVYTVIRPLVKSVKQEINFLISQQDSLQDQPKHMLWVLKRNISFEHPKHMLKMMGKNIFTILC